MAVVIVSIYTHSHLLYCLWTIKLPGLYGWRDRFREVKLVTCPDEAATRSNPALTPEAMFCFHTDPSEILPWSLLNYHQQMFRGDLGDSIFKCPLKFLRSGCPFCWGQGSGGTLHFTWFWKSASCSHFRTPQMGKESLAEKQSDLSQEMSQKSWTGDW
jgi:hypothetical protein